MGHSKLFKTMVFEVGTIEKTLKARTISDEF